MKLKTLGKKQSHILFTLTIVGLISLAGLVVDGSVAFISRYNAEQAVSSAAQAGAIALSHGKDAASAAQLRAASDGYGNDSSRVTVNNPPGIGCDGKNSPFAGNPDYVQVIIQSNFTAYFAQVAGIRESYICVEAIENATQSTHSLLD
jgi:Flp pilus assembly protein TadG